MTVDDFITPNSKHQWYTHLGWDHDYRKELPKGWTKEWGEDQQKKFLSRKEIIISTVKNIFPNLSRKKINSLAALLYLNHIRGDLRNNDSPENLPSISEWSKQFRKHLKILYGYRAFSLNARIKKNLKSVTFENCAEPLDRVSDDISKTVPKLVKSEGYSPKTFGIIGMVLGLIVLIIILLLLLRNCNSVTDSSVIINDQTQEISSLEITVPEESIPTPVTAPISAPPTTHPLPAQYTVRPWLSTGDSFWNIAGQPWVYDDPTQWMILYDANRDKLPQPGSPDHILPGIILDIPSIQGEIREGLWVEGYNYIPFR